MPAISPTVYTGPYTANGTQTQFSFNFSIVGATDIAVEVDDVAISSLLYTVEFNATGGTISFATPRRRRTGDAPVCTRLSPDQRVRE